MPKFIVHLRNDSSTSFWLDEEDIFIGRVPTINDICINDESVSRQHAHVKKREEGWTLYDLKSLNGVWVNGESISRKVLKDQDQIQLGDVKIIFELHEMTPEEELDVIEKTEQTKAQARPGIEKEITKRVKLKKKPS